MSVVEPTRPSQIEYPESDGRPMRETDLHRDWMFRILEILRRRYRDQRVYLASDLLVYYEEGSPHRFVVPDIFVVLDCDPGRRRTFKSWVEGKDPHVVFEVTSRSTRTEDERDKTRIYEQIGVQEYFLYDPTSDYLQPPLKGFRQTSTGFAEIPSSTDHGLVSQKLGILLKLKGDDLEFIDGQTNQPLLTGEETERAAKEAERETRLAEREAAERHVAKLQAELEALRRRLGEQAED